MKKYLFYALAASAALVGCTSEELVPQKSVEAEKTLTMESVVGADLTKVEISLGDETRATNGGWNKGDKLGLAWFNLETAGITGTQNSTNFFGATSSVKANWSTEIYGNHLYTVNENGDFQTQANVYQGAHFVYFPYAYASQIQQKVVNVNAAPFEKSANADMTDFAYDRFNKAFHMSSTDFIPALTSNDQTLKMKFIMNPMVNVIDIKGIPSADFTGNDVLKALKVTSYALENASQSPYAEVATIVPADIPEAAYIYAGTPPVKTTILDKALNRTNLDAYAKSLAAVRVNKIERTVKTGYTLDNTYEYPLFTLPTNPAYTTEVTGVPATEIYDNAVVFNVQSATGLNGKFTVKRNDADATNKNTMKYLDTQLLGAEQNIFRNAASEWSYIGLQVNLTKANFVMDYTITNLAQWNDAVAIVEALGAATATFNVTGDVKFNAGEIKTAGKITAVTTGAGKLTIDSDVELPANSKLDLTGATVVVNAGKSLTIKDNDKLASDNVTNNGTIVLGYKSEIGVKNAAGTTGIDNTNGRINVVYGSYGYVASTKEGIVAYVVPADYQCYKINALTATVINSDGATGHNSIGTVSVNTLVVGTGVSLNLNKLDGDTTDNDPYNGATIGGTALADMSNITIEMTGGTLYKGTGANTTVKAINAVSGNSVALQVNTDKINVKNGAVLTVKDLDFATTAVVSNDGTMIIDATKTMVGGVPTVTYTETFTTLNNGKGTGNPKAELTVTANVKTLNLTEVYNGTNGTIIADNKSQVLVATNGMHNDGTLVRVTQ